MNKRTWIFVAIIIVLLAAAAFFLVSGGRYRKLDKLLTAEKYSDVTDYCTKYLSAHPHNKRVKGYLLYSQMVEKYEDDLDEAEDDIEDLEDYLDYFPNWMFSPNHLKEKAIDSGAFPREYLKESRKFLSQELKAINKDYDVDVESWQEFAAVLDFCTQIGAFRVGANKKTKDADQALYFTMLAKQSYFQNPKADKAIVKLLDSSAKFQPWLWLCGTQLRPQLVKGLNNKSIQSGDYYIPQFLAACYVADHFSKFASAYPKLTSLNRLESSADTSVVVSDSVGQEGLSWDEINSQLREYRQGAPIHYSLYAESLLKTWEKTRDFDLDINLLTGEEESEPYILAVEGYDLSSRQFISWYYVFQDTEFKEMTLDGKKGPFRDKSPRYLLRAENAEPNQLYFGEIVSTTEYYTETEEFYNPNKYWDYYFDFSYGGWDTRTIQKSREELSIGNIRKYQLKNAAATYKAEVTPEEFDKLLGRDSSEVLADTLAVY